MNRPEWAPDDIDREQLKRSTVHFGVGREP